VVIHVDRMRKLPISSLDESESSVDTSTDVNTHASEDKETSVLPSKRRKLQPATDVPTSRVADTENCSGGGDSILPVGETADNRSNVFYDAINAAAEAVSDSPDTFWTPHLASQWTGNAGDYARTPTGSLLTLCAGRRKRRHCGRPKQFLELFHISNASSPLIGRDNLRRGITSHGTCRLARLQAVAIVCSHAMSTRAVVSVLYRCSTWLIWVGESLAWHRQPLRLSTHPRRLSMHLRARCCADWDPPNHLPCRYVAEARAF